MKKKNGFTLVELLGVIVILAVLSLITIPIISNVINDVRIKSLQNSAYGLIEASNLYYAQYGNNSNIRFDIENNQISSNDTTNLLRYKGVVKEGTVILDKKGSVTVCITDGKNSAYKNYNETKVTTVKGKCEIKDNSSIVYLDDEATIDSYDNAKLTELVNELIEKQNNTLNEVYPIGSVYISMNDTNPSTLFGGTWEQIESGRMLQSTSTASGQLGGSQTASFTPTGTVGDTTLTVNQMPSHKHIIYQDADGVGSRYAVVTNYGLKGGSKIRILSDDAGLSDLHPGSGDNAKGLVNADYAGGNQPHTHTFTGNSTTINTVSPYITVYMYKRTA